eukprot:gene2553-3515_t
MKKLVGCLTNTSTIKQINLPVVNRINNKKISKKVPKYIEIEEENYSFNFFLNRNENSELELIKVKHLQKGIYETFNNSLICNFSSQELNYKHKYGYDLGSPLIKSISSKKKQNSEINVLDCTAGLGKDSFIFASFGFQVSMIEKNPIIFNLLFDGYQRGLRDKKISHIVNNMSLVHGDSLDYLKNSKQFFDVIYFDPMFPTLNKKNKISPRKEIQYIRELVEEREENLLEKAKEYIQFTEKLVIKRPKNIHDLM